MDTTKTVAMLVDAEALEIDEDLQGLVSDAEKDGRVEIIPCSKEFLEQLTTNWAEEG